MHENFITRLQTKIPFVRKLYSAKIKVFNTTNKVNFENILQGQFHTHGMA